jgi:molecular chaperone IbpA
MPLAATRYAIMLNVNLSPLFRTAVGFEPFEDLLDEATRVGPETAAWPPYNIEKIDDDNYRVVLAVPGFALEDLTIETREHGLVVAGKQPAREPAVAYLYRGLGAGDFERQFRLADYIKVADATLSNGLLKIHLAREVPERLKPRRIAIAGAAKTQKIEKAEKAA